MNEEEGNDGKEGKERQEVAKGFLLDERREGTAVADHYDGHGGVANVHHQVLVVAGLGADLRYTDMSKKGKGIGCVKSPLGPWGQTRYHAT